MTFSCDHLNLTPEFLGGKDLLLFLVFLVVVAERSPFYPNLWELKSCDLKRCDNCKGAGGNRVWLSNEDNKWHEVGMLILQLLELEMKIPLEEAHTSKKKMMPFVNIMDD